MTTDEAHRKGRRVLLVLEATIGGTRRHLRELALGLAARGWEVSIAYSNRRDPEGFARDLSRFAEAGIRCHEIPMARGFAPIGDAKAVRALRRLLLAHRPDVLHLISSKAGFIGRIAGWKLGLWTVYAPHCWAFEMDSPLRGFYRFVERALRPRTRRLVAVCSHEVRETLRLGYWRGKISRVYNGIEPPAEMPPRNPVRDIVFIGRASRQKGIDLLPAILARLREIRPETTMAVLSDVSGPLRVQLESMGAEILPYAGEAAAAKALSGSRILLMPSRWEAFPYLVLEAFEHGAAVVASEVGGIPEAVEDGVNGLLAPPGNVKATTSALLRLLWNPEEGEIFAERAWKTLARFPLSAMLDGIERAYDRDRARRVPISSNSTPTKSGRADDRRMP